MSGSPLLLGIDAGTSRIRALVFDLAGHVVLRANQPNGRESVVLEADELYYDVNRHVAVALNGAVVPRGVWDATRLQPGDTVEVLAPVAGG